MEILKDKIPNQVYQRLQAVGIESPDYFLLESKQEICNKTKLSNRDVNTLIALISTINLRKTNPDYSVISLGCPKLDSSIRGIPKCGITEIYGESGTGKTQIGLQLCLNVLGSIYICTEDGFPSKRLEELLSDSKEKKQIMDNIYIEHIYDLDKLKYCIDIKIPVLISKTNINLIIIDSITSIFRYDNESDDYLSRTENLRYLTLKLNQIAADHKVGVVCINQVTSDPNFGLKPCLGLSWSNLIRKRIQLFRENNQRKMKVVFAPDTGNNQITYIVQKEGIYGI